MGCSNPVVGSVVMGCFADIFYASKVLKSIMLQCSWWAYVLNICKASLYGWVSEYNKCEAKNGMIKI